jgi:hypothetical protein
MNYALPNFMTSEDKKEISLFLALINDFKIL